MRRPFRGRLLGRFGVEFNARNAYDALVSARSAPAGEAAGVDVVQLARDVVLAEQEFRRAGEYFSGKRAREEAREQGLGDWAKGLGWGTLAVASVTPFGTLGRFARAARAGQDVFEAGRAVGRAAEVAGRWDIPEGVDDLTRGVLEFQREAGVPFDEALEAVNRTRAAEGFEPVGDVARERRVVNPDIELAGKGVVPARLRSDVSPDDVSYRISHTAPTSDGGGPMHDLTQIYPDDIYGPDARRLYGDYQYLDDVDVESEAWVAVEGSRGNPDALVNIYRAVPETAPDEILLGDWVTPSRSYAEIEAGRIVSVPHKILNAQVPAKHLYTNGDSIMEWGYDPRPVGDVVRAAEEILPPAGIPDIDNMPALRAASEELPESAGMQYLREPLPGMRGAVSAEDMPAMRQAIREWRSRSSESALENPEFVNRVAQVLMDEADVRALALSYARMAPAGMAKNLDLRTAVLPRTLEAFANAEDAARGARPVISGGRPVSPLTQMNIIPSNAVAPHFEPYFYAARYVANPSKERLRQFAESLMRTHHNLYQGLDKGGRVGDIWYMERTDKAQSVASSIRTDAGEQAFDRIVVAFAMAGFSAGAPPILEPVRAIPSMPFLRAVGDDKVIFDVEAFSRVFPNLAAPKVVNGETVYEGGYNFWGAIAAAAAMTNPDVANQRVAGIAAKTFPYFVVTVDPLNPWAVVADRNFIYAASGHTLGGEYVTASGKTVKIAKPSTTEGAPLQAYRGILTAISRGIERVPSAGQEMDWFEPRLWLQHAVGESFVMGRGVSDARAQMLTAQPEMANIFPSDVEQSWDELVRYAFESAGSHPLVGGEANAKKVREIAARNRQKFIERVRSGQAPEWTMVGDQPIIRRDRWDLTMPIQVRLQPKSVEKVKESGLTVAELVASGEKIDETKFIRVGRQFMEDNETILGGFLRSLYQRDPRAAFSIIALLLPAAAVTGANVREGGVRYDA